MAGACAFLVAGRAGTAVLLLVLAVAICVVAALDHRPRLVTAGAVAIAVQGWLSAAGWNEALPQLDTVAHFAFALLAGVVLAGPFGAAGGFAAVTLGTLWELYEWASDAVLGTGMSLGYRDTLTDVAAVTAGAGVATWLALSGRAA